VGDLVAALQQLKAWRIIAENTLECGDPPFQSKEKELEALFKSAGKNEEWLDGGERGPYLTLGLI
jgi:hypothetical protein